MGSNADFSYAGASVLVTGASGFIGEHLCRYLSRQGARVTGVYSSHEPIGDHADWVQLDLTERDEVSDSIHALKPAFIFHLAGHVQGARGIEVVLPTFENNLSATLNLMLAAQQSGCCRRMVITNSQEEPEAGDLYAAPSSPYAASKFAASAYARMFNALYDLPIVIARVFMVYGPGQKDLSKLVPFTILRALAGQAPKLSSGVRKIDWIYIDDVIDGLVRMGKASGIDGETIDLGSGQTHTIKAVVKEMLGQIEPEINADFGAVTDRAREQERVADVRGTLSKLGWQAHVPLQEGIARTIAWYSKRRDVKNRAN